MKQGLKRDDGIRRRSHLKTTTHSEALWTKAFKSRGEVSLGVKSRLFAALTALQLLPGVEEDLPFRARADHLGRNLRKALEFIGARK